MRKSVLPLLLILAALSSGLHHRSGAASKQATSDFPADGVPWGLDRLDQRHLPLDSSYSAAALGLGVNVYILDSGIGISHLDFDGSIAYAPTLTNGDFVGDEWGRLYGAEDCHGHGTHTAGLVAGIRTGVAPGASVFAMRIADCNGHGAGESVIRAIDWLDHNAQQPAVVLMSLDYGDQPAVREAVKNSVAGGLTYIGAAGAGFTDACSTTPGGVNGVITIASSTRDDTQYALGNWGACIDLFAPGREIWSTDILGASPYRIRSGSSMAAAYAAGAAALFLEWFPHATPQDVKLALTSAARSNVLRLNHKSRVTDTPNLLLSTESF